MTGRNWNRTIGISVAVIAALVFLTIFILLVDFDGDGLKNIDEFHIGTNILNPDTYSDGLGDGIEVLGSLHLLDLKQSPSDVYSFAWSLEHKVLVGSNFQAYNSWKGRSWKWPGANENIFFDNGLVYYTSDPLSRDTDNDGLGDLAEYQIGTDPRSKDTDNDGLSDLFEVSSSKTIPVFNDSDSDLLGDGEEVQKFHTDPLSWDTDNDHLSDSIEVKGYDVNGDGIVDIDFPAYGANPFVKDIFIEVDWMPGARTLGSYSTGKLTEAFAAHDIVLHIDQGELGGGSVTQEGVGILYDNRPGPMNDLQDFKDKYFTPSRQGVFYWCLLAGGDTSAGNEQVGGFDYGDAFAVSGKFTTDGSLGSAFMHELGHGLGLSSDIFDGIDSTKYPFSVYQSVMNYNSMLFKGSEFYDYSEGGIFNDWVHIDFEYLLGHKP